MQLRHATEAESRQEIACTFPSPSLPPSVFLQKENHPFQSLLTDDVPCHTPTAVCAVSQNSSDKTITAEAIRVITLKYVLLYSDLMSNVCCIFVSDLLASSL